MKAAKIVRMESGSWLLALGFGIVLAPLGCGSGGDAGSGGAGATGGGPGASSGAAHGGGGAASASGGAGGGGASTGGSGGAGGSPPDCDLYVARAAVGAADCSSEADACTFAGLWTLGSAALAGRTTCILGEDPTTDGHYTGPDAMLAPPAGVTGTAAQPIKIIAYHDGGVDIDGENVGGPVRLGDGNDYFWLEGFDAHSSGPGHAVVGVTGNHNVLRRIVAWDAPLEWNTHVFSIAGHAYDDDQNGYANLLEDDAAFGAGRKMFETFQNHGTTFRRCWARWEGSINTGPKRDIQINYHSYNTIVDDFIARWDGHLVPDSYTLMTNGVPCLAPTCGCSQGTLQQDGSCLYENGFLQEADGAIGEIDHGASDPSPNGNDTISGVLALVRATDTYQCSPGNTAYGAITPATFGGQTFRDVFVYIEPGTIDKNKGLAPVGLKFNNPATGADPSSATHVTSIAEGNDAIGSTWTMNDYVTGQTLADLGPNETLYRGSHGGKLCHRHVDGALTPDPLWPWPMSARIRAATARASTDGHDHAIEDVDGVVQDVFGPFPAACRAP